MSSLLNILTFIDIRLLDVIDVLLVAALLYLLYKLIKGTVAINIFIGILAFYLIWQLVKMLQMELLSEILGQFISVGVIALIIVFQQEIRKFFLLLGTPTLIPEPLRKFFTGKSDKVQSKEYSELIVNSLERLASSKTGALLVLSRTNKLPEFTTTGVTLEARLSSELIESIFFKNNPLHDGAVILDRSVVKAAKCILPISGNLELPSQMGLRHRAGLGITEQTDAIALIVSEETGSLSYAYNGKIRHDVRPADMKRILTTEFGNSSKKK